MARYDDEFDSFVAHRYSALSRLGALLTGDAGHGEDLAQDALVITYRHWRRLHPDGNPEAYARRVMVRAAWRARRRFWRHEIPTAELPDSPGNDEYANSDATSAILAALRRLPAQQRVVLILRYWDDQSEEQIAKTLDIPPGTVKSRAARAISALRNDALFASNDLKGLLS